MSLRCVVLVNPNTSDATTELMAAIAREALTGSDLLVEGCTATHGPRMITSVEDLAASAEVVVALGSEAVRSESQTRTVAAVIVGAFGDPGVEELRRALAVPVIGIAEASLRAAAADGRRFGVATTTPALLPALQSRVEDLKLGPACTGFRFTLSHPLILADDPGRQLEELRLAVQESVDLDGAEAVVIGGGPLGESAERLRPLFDIPVLAPIRSACAEVLAVTRGQ